MNTFSIQDLFFLLFLLRQEIDRVEKLPLNLEFKESDLEESINYLKSLNRLRSKIIEFTLEVSQELTKKP